MFDSNTNVDILVNGSPIKKYYHTGSTFIQSNHQTQYSIRIKNKYLRQRLFVVSVDGINVIDGRAAGSTKMGYIINGQDTLEVKGFRTDTETEHPFKFSSKNKSYAKKSDQTNGDTSNCGVIGVEVYDEFIIPVYRGGGLMATFESTTTNPTFDLMAKTTCSTTCSTTDVWWCDSSRSLVRSSSVVPDFDMGTEFSKESLYSPVSTTSFNIGRKVMSVSIYYASREALIDAGVPIIKQVKISEFPQAFPIQFCKPPRS